MQLAHGLHLAYSTNVHRGETWAESLRALDQHTLRVKQAVSPNAPYGIGLRLSDAASRELSTPAVLLGFQEWLEQHDCYVFTINGFPYGDFHGTRVKENVYRPDWTSEERVAYTNRLFDLLAVLLPREGEGSVSTAPGSFKGFIRSVDQERQIRSNLWRCVEHIAALSEEHDLDLHLGLEPEPLGWLEDTRETVAFFEQMHDEHPKDSRLSRHLGVNYDTCHFAVEFEDAFTSLKRFQQANVRLSKIHLSNALRLQPSPEARESLKRFADNVYLHQVIARDAGGRLQRFRDLEDALNPQSAIRNPQSEEWRVHFHIPLHSQPIEGLADTRDHIAGTLDWLAADPAACKHLEMETYTWEVLPEPMRARCVEDQLIAEYQWTIGELQKRELASAAGS